jgi:SAM-dependent methyltransferase
LPLRAPAETEFFDLSHFPEGSRVLDVGCGEVKKVPWALGIDRVKTAAADVVHDLDVFPWPLPDNAFDAVVAAHVVEHVADVLKLFDELHRVCRAGATLRIATPHYTSPDAFADPTHRHALAYRSYEFLARPEDAALPALQRLLGRVLGGMNQPVAGWYTAPKFAIVERRITFRRLHRLIGVDRLAAQAPLVYEYFLGGLAPARDLQVVLKALK